METASTFFGRKRDVRAKCERVPPKTRAACYYFGLRSRASGARNRTAAVEETVKDVCTSKKTYKACVYGAATAFLKNKMHTDVGAQGARFCATLGDATWACIDGLMFRTAKFGSEALRRGACAALRGDAAALCRDVAAAGMGCGRGAGRVVRRSPNVSVFSSAIGAPGRDCAAPRTQGGRCYGLPVGGAAGTEEQSHYVLASDL